MRLVLAALLVLSLWGIVDLGWWNPALFVVPVLLGLCFALLDRIDRLERGVARTETRLAELLARVAPRSEAADFPRSEEISFVEPVSVAAAAREAREDGIDAQFAFSAAAEDSSSPGIPPAAQPHQPYLLARFGVVLKDWLLGGNPVVKAGVVVLFLGVSFLLNYAAEHRLVSVEYRLAGAGLLGAGLFVLGWTSRRRKRLFGLLAQGGGIGILYLTLFAAARFFGFAPMELALLVMLVLVGASGALAVVQDAVGLAVLASTGGFAAPILLSTGTGNHVHLFAYYALLNVGVLGVAWFRSWRPLNLLGFVCTFGIGALWGAEYYAPAYFRTTEPFLILFFLMYSVVSVLFARDSGPGRPARLDSALVFGLPLAAFGLQVALVRDMEFGSALSSLVLGGYYLAVARLFPPRVQGLHILGEAHLALGVLFASLAVPLAVNASWTASTWALEGAAMVWLGLRQNRLVTRVLGLILQIAGGLSCLVALNAPLAESILAGPLLPGLLVAVGGLLSSLAAHHFRAALTSREQRVSVLCGAWGGAWWYGIWASQLPDHVDESAPGAMLLVTGVSSLVWAWLHGRNGWEAGRHLVKASLPILALVLLEQSLYPTRHPFGHLGWLGWPMALGGHFAALKLVEGQWGAGWREWTHSLGAPLLVALILRETHWIMHRVCDPGAWTWAMDGMTVLVCVVLVSKPLRSLPWPVRAWEFAYLRGTGGVVLGLGLWFAGASAVAGDPAPLPFAPVLNPLDLAQAASVVAAWLWAVEIFRLERPGWRPYRRFLPPAVGGLGFVWLNVVIARTVHFWGAVPYSGSDLLRSAVFQASLSVVWSVAALLAMSVGWRWGRRPAWFAGAGLMAVVVGKLFLVDLSGSGTVARIVSFLGAGLLMLVVGYLCPLPPRAERS